MHDDITLSDDAVCIPLRRRDGSVRAYAVVDAADSEWVNLYRWSIDSDGYAKRAERHGKTIQTFRLNRELLGLQHGDVFEGDHIDRDKLNNRRGNLRKIPRPAQQQNHPSHKGARSSHRGVNWCKQTRKWRATLRVGGKNMTIGRYLSEDDAAEAARLARLRLMPYAVD